MAAKAKPPNKRVELNGYVDSRLRDLAIKQAEIEQVPLSEIVAHLVAKAIGRMDLSKVPRHLKIPRAVKNGKDKAPTKVQLRGYVNEQLRDIIIEQAEAEGIPLSEAVAHLVAKALDRPDLAKVPRRRLGRPLLIEKD
jgi:uncharacterized protein YjiS (DUF1127 family)